MLTAGYTTQDVRRDYAEYYGADADGFVSQGEIDKHKKGTGPPIARILLFLVVGVAAVVLVLGNRFASTSRKKKSNAALAPLPGDEPKSEGEELGLINDLLDDIDDPLS